MLLYGMLAAVRRAGVADVDFCGAGDAACLGVSGGAAQDIEGNACLAGVEGSGPQEGGSGYVVRR